MQTEIVHADGVRDWIQSATPPVVSTDADNSHVQQPRLTATATVTTMATATATATVTTMATTMATATVTATVTTMATVTVTTTATATATATATVTATATARGMIVDP